MYYLNYRDIDRIARTFIEATNSHGTIESIRAALHEAGFVLEGDILDGECKSGLAYSQYVHEHQIYHFLDPKANWMPQVKKFNDRHDAYYCETCDKWLEKKCNDDMCEYCTVRPDKPSEVK